jgi:hypothetical protein
MILRQLRGSRHPDQPMDGPVPTRETADSCAKIVFPQPVKSGVIEVRMPKTEEAKKNAITVKIDRVLVS